MKNFLTALVLLSLNSCASKPIPPWGGNIYAGSSADKGVVRKQENETIPFNDSRFNQMRCMSDEEFQRFVNQYVIGCDGWGK